MVGFHPCSGGKQSTTTFLCDIWLEWGGVKDRKTFKDWKMVPHHSWGGEEVESLTLASEAGTGVVWLHLMGE